jgi:hypothetical protein
MMVPGTDIHRDRKSDGMSDQSSGSGSQPRRAGSRRAGSLVTALAGLALLAAACGGGGSSAAGKPAAYQKSLAFAQCMRARGEPSWPDPTSQGTFSAGQIDINAPQYHSALAACLSLLPPGVAPLQLSAAQQQELLSWALKMAACMRTHGITRWPDPTPREARTGRFSLAGSGISHREAMSPPVQSAFHACMKATGGGP